MDSVDRFFADPYEGRPQLVLDVYRKELESRYELKIYTKELPVPFLGGYITDEELENAFDPKDVWKDTFEHLAGEWYKVRGTRIKIEIVEGNIPIRIAWSEEEPDASW